VIGLNLKNRKTKTIGLLYLIFLILFSKFLAVSKRADEKDTTLLCVFLMNLWTSAYLRNVE
jgi:hypothetical protein